MRPVPKKHHFVPQFLLEHFADAGRRLTVHRLSGVGNFQAAVTDVGHRNLGHTIFMPGQEPDHESLERGMSNIEGAAATVIRDLLESTSRRPSPSQQEVLAWLVALQWQRHRMLLDLLREKILREHPVDPGAPEYEFATKSLGLHAIAINVTTPWSNRDDPAARPKERWNSIVSRLCNGMTWKLLRPRTPTLVISDNLVCLSGVSTGQTTDLPPAYAKHGLGIAFENFQRLTMPLTPTLGLVISHDERDATKVTSRQMNQYTVFNSREFVAHHPKWPTTEPRLHAATLEDLELQRWLARSIFPGLRI